MNCRRRLASCNERDIDYELSTDREDEDSENVVFCDASPRWYSGKELLVTTFV
jgi:hypothetical protein